MPFFSAIYFAARHTPGISEATFLGINLGSTSLILTVVAGILYYAQSLLMQVGMDEEQKKQMKTMALMNPIMIMMFSFGSPAGVSSLLGCRWSLRYSSTSYYKLHFETSYS